jgi:hypothetical protein
MSVWITNFNNLNRGFSRLVDWLIEADVPFTVIDNASTWEPLLRYYEAAHFPIVRCEKNLGPYAFWELGFHQAARRFIVTDPDVVPCANCPRDLLERMSLMMDRGYSTVGPSLRIDNLPDCYDAKNRVIAWEQQWWQRPVDGGFEANLDTTFSMYEEGTMPRAWDNGLQGCRLAPPYQFEHLPWYEGPGPNPERDFYNATRRKEWTNW